VRECCSLSFSIHSLISLWEKVPQNAKHLICLFLKNRIILRVCKRQKILSFVVSQNLKHSQLQNFWMYWKYRVIIKFLFLQNTRSHSNFNRIYDYDYGTQGLTWSYTGSHLEPYSRGRTVPLLNLVRYGKGRIRFFIFSLLVWQALRHLLIK